MSASRRPTSAPAFLRAAARLTATVDLPTPPLPDATAIVCFTPGRISLGFGRMKDWRTLAVIRTWTSLTPGISPTRSWAWVLKRSRTGHAGVVSSNVKLTLPCGLTSSSLIIPRLTTSRPRSGSWTVASTSSTCCNVGAMVAMLPGLEIGPWFAWSGDVASVPCASTRTGSTARAADRVSRLPRVRGRRHHPRGQPDFRRRVGRSVLPGRAGAWTRRARDAPAVFRSRRQGARPLDAARRLRQRRGVPPPHVHRGLDALLSRPQQDRHGRPQASAGGGQELRTLARRRARAARAARDHPGGPVGDRPLSRTRSAGAASRALIRREPGHRPAAPPVRTEPLAQRSTQSEAPGASLDADQKAAHPIAARSKEDARASIR